MKNLVAAAFILLMAIGAKAQTKWNIDNSHTVVKFSVTHLGVSESEGEFKKFTGAVVSKSEDFQNAQIEFSAEIASVSTGSEDRDKHLKSDDFFNAEKYPTMSFKSTSFKKVSGNKYVLEGDLTIRDVTKHVKLDVVYNGTAQAWGKTVAGFKITGVINRFDYNLKWNKLIETTSVVGSDVTITINLELNKQ
ncbi:MAG: YceI family protein [Chitinophagales bacterium]